MPVLQTILEAIKVDFETVMLEPTYDMAASSIDLAERNLLAADRGDFPNITLASTGSEEVVVDDTAGDVKRMEAELMIRGSVNTATQTDMNIDLEKLESSVKALIDSAQTLTGSLQWKLLEVQERGFRPGPDRFLGYFFIRTRLLYVVTGSDY